MVNSICGNFHIYFFENPVIGASQIQIIVRCLNENHSHFVKGLLQLVCFEKSINLQFHIFKVLPKTRACRFLFRNVSEF